MDQQPMANKVAYPGVTARDLQRAVADLQTTRPGPGLVKTAIWGAFTLLAIACALGSASWSGFFLFGPLAAVAYAAWFITTHDAIHHTLTGWRWFDELVPRLLAWPVFWLHGTYSEIHKLHHKMNGDDLEDPERVQWTVAEYEQAGALGRWYVRHQWFFDILIGGGIQMILVTARQAIKFAPRSRGLRRQLAIDLTGILVTNAIIYGLAFAHGLALKWLLLWFLLERVTGAIIQWRAHIEHYGLWGKGRHYFETQIYACRNITTWPLVSRYFNRLNFHSVHHAFPRVPFYLLPEAHRRFQELYRNCGTEPLIQSPSYLGTTLALAAVPAVIGEPEQTSLTGRRRMVFVADLAT